ncbi:DUF1127 domain-containing protein [Rhizobium sp. KVB221]|uniref:DUF1127 domain-containing protein n=1 Tax=Rhizobium setariae TaxID=2801340 RepID=A0A936YLL2_9HYPH|nr:DUF1127 domain-containing protein [Rhizobium setariae]MBL0370414.1 DUF1127 domain-containing protein [Rhizobium setariae]
MTFESIPSAGIIQSLLARASSAFAGNRQTRANREVLRDLASHPDYLLFDIGISRDDVEFALYCPSSAEAASLLVRARRNPLRDGKAI